PVAEVLQVVGQLVDLGALLADDDADARRVDEDGHLLAGPLDADLGDAGPGVALLDELPDLGVLDEQLREVRLVGVPAALPIDHDAGAEARRPNLLPHSGSLDSIGHGSLNRGRPVTPPPASPACRPSRPTG